MVSPQEFGEHGELVHAALVDSQDGEFFGRGGAEFDAGCEFLPQLVAGMTVGSEPVVVRGRCIEAVHLGTAR